MIDRFALPLAALCVLLALVGGCSSIDVKSNTVPGADLSKYGTYSWQPLTHTTSETRIDPSSPTHVEIKRLVDSELAASGLKPAPPGKSDLIVRYAVARLDDYSRSIVSDAGRYDDGYRPSAAPDTRINDVERGSLVVDVNDASTGKLLWRGTARTNINPDSGPVRDKALLHRAVHELFEDFRR